jgi:hypothetical protein
MGLWILTILLLTKDFPQALLATSLMLEHSESLLLAGCNPILFFPVVCTCYSLGYSLLQNSKIFIHYPKSKFRKFSLRCSATVAFSVICAKKSVSFLNIEKWRLYLVCRKIGIHIQIGIGLRTCWLVLHTKKIGIFAETESKIMDDGCYLRDTG